MAPKLKASGENKKNRHCKSPTVCSSFTSPLGYIHVTACPEGLHNVSLEEGITDENFSPNKSVNVQLLRDGHDEFQLESEVMKTCLQWLKTYFHNVDQIESVPRPEICAFKQPNPGFRARVWKALADDVGPGEVITYGELAAKLKNPGAVRAVGSAMSNNPNGIIVPCHRVVRASGMGLYHGGQRQAVKMWLLKHEGLHKYS